jgi:hypothetical protein
MTHEQIIAVEKFARDYRDTIANSMLSKEPIAEIAIDYAVRVLDVQLDLARIDFNLSADKEASYHAI